MVEKGGSRSLGYVHVILTFALAVLRDGVACFYVLGPAVQLPNNDKLLYNPFVFLRLKCCLSKRLVGTF